MKINKEKKMTVKSVSGQVKGGRDHVKGTGETRETNAGRKQPKQAQQREPTGLTST
jgi:hypothetical protein